MNIELTAKELDLIYMMLNHEIKEGLASPKDMKVIRALHDKLEHPAYCGGK